MVKKTILKIIKEMRFSKNKREYKIYILDRLAEGDLRVILGDEIIGITEFDQIILKDGSTIPIHRIVRIEYGKEVLIDRTSYRFKGMRK